MVNFPEVVHFKITTKCNQNCRYCYDSKKHSDLDFSELKKIFELLGKNGVKALVLTGGEPLIRTDILEIFAEIKKQGMKIYLDTNGDFFFKYKASIDKYVDILGLPLDFSSGNKCYRSNNNFETVLKILEYYSEAKKRPEIRVGTVITQENVYELNKIADLLQNFKIDLWKIYQFIPIGPNAIANQKSLEVSLDIFDKETLNLAEKYSKYFKVVISKRKHRASAYFFISSDGTVFMPQDTSEFKGDKDVGSIFDKDILVKWDKEVNINNYNNNVQVTFKNKVK